MRVLHTSDWHIGRRFKGIDLLEYQRKALEWLIGLIKREQVDVLCVSGDVYDAPRPSAGAVRLFNEMFQRLGLMESTGIRSISYSRPATTIPRLDSASPPR